MIGAGRAIGIALIALLVPARRKRPVGALDVGGKPVWAAINRYPGILALLFTRPILDGR
jgi:hypothetical protein